MRNVMPYVAYDLQDIRHGASMRFPFHIPRCPYHPRTVVSNTVRVLPYGYMRIAETVEIQLV